MERVVKRILAIAVSLSMLFSMAGIRGNTASAYMKADITQTRSSDLSDLLSHYWEASLKDGMLTVDLTDIYAQIDSAGGSQSCEANMYLDGSTLIDNKEFTGNKCTLSADFSKQKDGVYKITIRAIVRSEVQNYSRWAEYMYLEIEDGKVYFYSPYGAASIKAMKNLTDNYDPQDCLNTKTYEYMHLCESYDDIVAKAEEIAKDCITEGDKVKAIHDWICKNVAYDYTKDNTTQKLDIDRAFQDGYTVCGGFTDLANLMYRSVGIPCVFIIGFSNSAGGLEDGTENLSSLQSNHGWNAVYYNNAWHYVDLTWDCKNKYYGEGNSRTTSGKDPGYRYFGMPAEMYGMDHYESFIEDHSEDAVELVLKNVKTNYMLGESFDKNCSFVLKTNKGNEWTVNGKTTVSYEGYDLNKLGKQTVTATYKGLTTTYEINVYEADSIKVVPKENAEYKFGTEFKPQFDLYIVTSAGDEIPVKDLSDVTCSGYDMDTPGKQTVTVSYQGKTTEYQIEVTKGYKINYVLNGGENNKDNPDSYSIEADVVLKEPTREGYRFTGWYTDKAMKNRIFMIRGDSTGDATLYAGWEEEETCTHEWGSWDVTTIATCTKTGTKVRQCYVCMKTETATVPIDSKKHMNMEVRGKVAATTTSTGYTGDTHCKDCGTLIKKGTTTAQLKSTQNTTKTTTSQATTKQPDATTEQTVTVPKAVKGIKLVNKKGKAVKITWKKLSGVKGYEVQYALNSKFTKGKKTLRVTSVSRTVKKLKKKSTYYVRVRAYTMDGSKKVYGKYSSIKKIKIKR